MNSALTLFVKKGYGATTTDEIAACCKISKQTLYRLFPGKAALFAAVIEAHRQKWLDFPPPGEDRPLAETLAQIFMVDISEESHQERIDVIRLVLTEGRNFPELTQILKEHGSDFFRRQLADWLSAQSGRIGLKSQDMMKMAQILMDMVFGAIVMKNVGEMDWPDSTSQRAHTRRCIDIFLHGVTVAVPDGNC